MLHAELLLVYFVRAVLRYQKVAYVAFIFWLLTSVGGACLHLCFDGAEPPSALHLDTLDSSHMQHSADVMHDDTDISLNQSILTQLINLSIPLIMALVLLIPLLVAQKNQYHLFSPTRLPCSILTLSPPLRAPPFLHA